MTPAELIAKVWALEKENGGGQYYVEDLIPTLADALEKAESLYIEQSAILEAVEVALQAGPVSDFMESFPVVRKIGYLVTSEGLLHEALEREMATRSLAEASLLNAENTIAAMLEAARRMHVQIESRGPRDAADGALAIRTAIERAAKIGE